MMWTTGGRVQVLLDDLGPWLWYISLLLAFTINIIMLATWYVKRAKQTCRGGAGAGGRVGDRPIW